MYKLLIVDDNCYERDGISKLKFWNEFGFDEIFFAEDGAEGLEKALGIKPQLVITDVRMPRMDGLNMSKEIYENLPDTKFIFMSCFDDSKYIKSAIDVNAYGYILKPIDIGRLYAIVEHIMKVNARELDRQNQLNILERQIKKEMPILRNQIIRDLFYSNAENFQSADAEKLGMEIKKYFAVAAVQIDSFDGINSKEEADKVYYTINKIKNYLELCDSKKRIYGVVLSKKQIGIILFLDNVDEMSAAEEECVEFFNSFKDNVRKSFETDISVCIGGIGKSFSEISVFFELCERVLEANLFAKRRSVVFASEIGAEENLFDFSVTKLEGEISNIIESGDKKAAEYFIDKYYSAKTVGNRELVRRFTASVVGIIQVVLISMDENFQNIFGDDYIIWDKLSRFETIFDIRQWISNILFSICDYMTEKKSSRQAKLINRIKEIISESYGEINSVNEIAERLYISTVHANSIFKKYTGETIFDYLTRFKIEKAKKMLKEENSRIYEIAEKTGYKSKTYFTSLFKEYTGMTPREYRERGEIEK